MTQKFKEFRLGDVFDVRYVNRVKSTKKGHNYMYDTDVISEDGKYPYICAISTKNGVKGYSNIEPNNEGDCITLSTTADSSATVFYQPFPFIGRQQIAGIRRLDGEPMGERIGLYVATIIRKITKLFNYSYKLTIDWLQNMTIELPVTETGDPDWVYMDRYIQEIEDRYIQEIEDYFEVAGIDSVELTDDEKEILQKIPKFHEFKLWEIADLFYGNKYDKNKMTHNNPKVNFVSRTAKNNGVTDVVDKTDQQPFEQGALTLAFGGSVGSCFLQTEPFYTGQNVGVIVIPNVSENAKLYVKTCLEKRCKQEFVAFSYEINRHFKTDLAVYLPIDESTGKPDWDYMNDYIHVLKKVVIQKYANSQERKIMLTKELVKTTSIN